MTTKFKPCPFCGYDNIGVKSVVLDRFMGKNSPCSAITRVWAYCRVCDCEGPKRTGDLVYDSEIIALAAESWNHRPVKKIMNSIYGDKKSVYADTDSIKIREAEHE